MADKREQMSVEELLAASRERQRARAVGNGGVRGAVAMSDEECRKLCSKAGKEYLSGYESRVLSYVITNETCDRYGDIVRARGVKLDNYLKNPTVLYSHAQQELPVGASLKVWCDKSAKNVQAHALFLDDRVDTSGRSDLVYKFARAGFMPGCSIGFMPGDVARPNSPEERDAMGLGPYGVEYLTCELLEWSPCSVPANPDALALSFKSIDKALTRDITREDLLAAEKSALFDAELLDVVEHVLLGTALKCCRVRDAACASDAEIAAEDKYVEDAIADNEELAPILRPYPSEHACRLRPPSRYDDFRRGVRKHEGKAYSVIWGKVKGEDTWEEQAYRYPKAKWDVDDAREHCKAHDGMLFEPAAEPKSSPAIEPVAPTTVVNAVVDMGHVVEMTKQITQTIDTLRSFSESVLGELRSATEVLRCAGSKHAPTDAGSDASGEPEQENVRSMIRTFFGE